MTEEELYRRLQQQLDTMPIAYPATDSGVELRILQHLFTADEARVALCLSALPETLVRIHRRASKLPITVEELERTLDRLVGKGVIEGQRIRGKKHYSKSIFVIGMYERQVNRLTADFQQDVLQYVKEGFGEALHTGRTSQMRTIPIDKSIIPDRKVGTYDSSKKFIQESPGPFAVMNCICRQGMDLLGQPCQQTEIRETCLTLGSIAQSSIERGMARPLSREEILGLLERASDQGMVLQPQNLQAPLFICCCCGCCCGVLTSAKRFPRPARYFSTNYYADIDPEVCIECGTCSDRCQMDALITDDAATVVDLDRCIGCGICVSACPSGAIQLRRKDTERLPPKGMQELYKRIMLERFGPWAMAKVMVKKLLGLQI